MDSEICSKPNPSTSELKSVVFLQALNHLLHKVSSSHIGHNLEFYYGWDWDAETTALIAAFRQGGGSLYTIKFICETWARLLPDAPKPSIVEVSEMTKMTLHLVDDIGKEARDQNIIQQHVNDAFVVFQVASTALTNMIDHHVTILHADDVQALLECCAGIFKIALQMKDELCDSQELVSKYARPGITRRQLPRFIAMVWKFELLEKALVSAQMQLRVMGVTIMCNDLIELHTSSRAPDASQNPLLLSFADFILHKKIVDYLVGTGAHPEILSESINILGFLIVTKTYKDEQTDMIWSAIRNSQDSRVTQAVLRMVSECFKHYSQMALLYICQKMIQLPTQSFFSLPMREFCDSLFINLKLKHTLEHGPYLAAPPYELCACLIRESSIIDADHPDGCVELQDFAAPRFRELLQIGPEPSDRTGIYLSCIKDISEKSPTAPGSICVINLLLAHNMEHDLAVLTKDHGLTELVVAELESHLSDTATKAYQTSPAYLARQDLLRAIIVYAPETITDSLGLRLWNLLVGADARSKSNRDAAWHIINRAMAIRKTDNGFLKRCFDIYLTDLPSKFYTHGALEFANLNIAIWLKRNSQGANITDLVSDYCGMAQLWRMIIHAPADTIEADAIRSLVDVYVHSSFILTLSPIDAEAMHLALIRRCLSKLEAAAEGLGVSKIEKDGPRTQPMSNKVEPATNESTIARVLAVLREFSKAYEIKPHFAASKLFVPMPVAPTACEGDPMIIKYQSFDKGSQSDIRQLTLGKKNNTASLIASLQNATGFRQCKLFYRGREFEPNADQLSDSLELMDIHGLFLVKRISDEEEARRDHGKSAVQTEITQALPRLCSYLGLQENIAQEVSTCDNDVSCIC